jgi:hypothetical protein
VATSFVLWDRSLIHLTGRNTDSTLCFAETVGWFLRSRSARRMPKLISSTAGRRALLHAISDLYKAARVAGQRPTPLVAAGIYVLRMGAGWSGSRDRSIGFS